MIHHKYFSLIPFLILLMISFPGCTDDSLPNHISLTKENPKETPIELLPPKVPIKMIPKPQPPIISQMINGFAIDLYAQLRSQKGNLFFSPYSLSAALTMSYTGARGKTKEEMVKVLHLGGNESAIHNNFGQLEQLLSSQTIYQLEIANAIWLQQRKVFLAAEFTELLQETYHLGVKTADFEKEGEKERSRINAWIADKTAHKISTLLKPGMLNAQTQWVLTNAMYFKGKWQLPFRPEETKPLSFLNKGQAINIPTMHQKTRLNYFENDKAQMIELPYQTSESSLELSMVILLPLQTDETGLSQVEEKLGDYLRLQGNLKPLEVSVYLPKFKVEATFQLQEVLRKLGMIEAFEPGKADFSGMTGKKELAISDVVHQAFVEVNEEGTEVAVATAVMGSRGRSLVFRADHPFVFWILEKRSGTILFLGRVMEPQ